MKQIKRRDVKRKKIIIEQGDETLVSYGRGGSRLHSGNKHTSDGAVRESFHKVKDLADTINACMDSGFYDKEIIAECERLGIGFNITAEQRAPLMAKVQGIEEDKWIEIRDDIWVSEIEYRPSGWPKEYCFLVRSSMQTGHILTIGMLAYNIVNWIKRIKRLAMPSIYKKRLLKALRYRFSNVAARVVKHSRYVTLRIAKRIHRFTDIMFAYERIPELQFA